MNHPDDGWFIDTNVLLRSSRRPEHEAMYRAVEHFRQSRCNLYGTPQVIAEYWNVCTRPLEKNGFGLTIPEVQREVSRIERFLTILPETLEVFAEWKRLVTAHEVRGVQVHDARWAANMRVHGVANLLTLNGADFRRFPDIRSVKPAELI
ncbi:MAG: type II toxin-antitoxin system VapC family toxin [Bryobacteraceae bacterium]|nr:type II toxin-antitoxin system VapC family toxin [Bryobacteraceae bacterium]